MKNKKRNKELPMEAAEIKIRQLAGKDDGYKVPEDYFSTLYLSIQDRVSETKNTEKRPFFSIFLSPRLYYISSIIIIGALALSIFLFLNDFGKSNEQIVSNSENSNQIEQLLYALDLDENTIVEVMQENEVSYEESSLTIPEEESLTREEIINYLLTEDIENYYQF